MRRIWMGLVFLLIAGICLAGSEEGKKDEALAKAENLAASLAVDVSKIMATDGQPLFDPVRVEGARRTPSPRPDNPDSLPDTDAGHWWDREWSPYNVEKVNIPESPKDGAIGKRVITIWAGDHPYVTNQMIGQKMVADAYQMDVKGLNGNWDPNFQAQLVDEAIIEEPDMILLQPLDTDGAVKWARKINEAGIPVIIFGTGAKRDAYKYALCFTGADNWGQFRMLARAMADKMGKKGGYCVVQHAPGIEEHFSRTWGPVTELLEYAPEMKMLDMAYPGLDVDKTRQLVADWITRYGDDLGGIIVAVDQFQGIGTVEACKNAGRLDDNGKVDNDEMIIIAAGNSKIGMENVKKGWVYAETYQSAQGDGSLPLKIAADWFNGKEIEEVYYLPKVIITQENVDQYPGQW